MLMLITTCASMVQAGVLLQYVVLSGDDGSGAPDSVETCKNSGICYSLQSVFTSMREELVSATSEILVVVYLSAAAHVTPSGIVLEIPHKLVACWTLVWRMRRASSEWIQCCRNDQLDV
jgi:hypothetical protein